MNYREMLLQYSTQASVNASTYPTIRDLLDEIAADLATTQSTGWRVGKMNDYLSQNWKWFASTSLYTTSLTADQAVYGFTTDMRFENIKAVLVSDSTLLSSTAKWTEYALGGSAETPRAQTYYKALHGFGVYPAPTSDEDDRCLGVIYSPLPPRYSTETLTTVPNVSPDYLTGMKSWVKAEIAKSGPEPDVDLANNHMADALEVVGEAKMAHYKRDAHDKANRASDYKKHWYRG